jgi:hypothetical protein
MNRYHLPLLGAALLLAAGSAQAPAQSSGGPYRIDPAVTAGGGSTIAGGHYRLRGTLGQAATRTLSGGRFSLHDGYWATDEFIFHSGFEPEGD